MRSCKLSSISAIPAIVAISRASQLHVLTRELQSAVYRNVKIPLTTIGADKAGSVGHQISSIDFLYPLQKSRQTFTPQPYLFSIFSISTQRQRTVLVLFAAAGGRPLRSMPWSCSQGPDTSHSTHSDCGSTGRQAQLEGAPCQFSMRRYISETPEMSLASSNLLEAW